MLIKYGGDSVDFNPGLSIGEILKNADIVDIFKCGNMGGMRRSNKTNTLVIVSDYTKGTYQDKWIGGVLHYTGMGKKGDQDINWSQNATLASCGHNGIGVHLFEVIDPGEYIYCGKVELVDKPYTEIQADADGIARKVWMFPIRPIQDNDVKKPDRFVFKDMEDFKVNGKKADEEYAKELTVKKKRGVKNIHVSPASSEVEKIKKIHIPKAILGRQVKHKSFGIGSIIEIEETSITVNFDKKGLKKMGYEFCIENNILQFI